MKLIVSSKDYFKSDLVNFPSGVLVGYSHKSPIKEGPNEDSIGWFEVNDESIVLVVCDGVGGHDKGEKASREILKTFETVFVNNAKEISVRSKILNTLEKANKRVLQKYKDAMSTVVVVEITKNKVQSYHVGDSVFQLYHKDKGLLYKTVSHSPYGYLTECGYPLSETESIRHLIFNALGSKDMRIEISPTLKITNKSKIFLATDGIIDNLLNKEIKNILDVNSMNNIGSEFEKIMEIKSKENPDYHPDDYSFIVFSKNK